jgi:hypothetical protein
MGFEIIRILFAEFYGILIFGTDAYESLALDIASFG